MMQATRLDSAAYHRLVLAVACEKLNPGFRVRRRPHHGLLRTLGRLADGCWPGPWRLWCAWSLPDRVLFGTIFFLAALYLSLGAALWMP